MAQDFIDPEADAGVALAVGEDWERRVVEREALDERGNSGSSLERLVLDDGSRLVVKRLSAESDRVMRVTNDTGRLAKLWRSGVLDRLPRCVDHTIVRVDDDGEGWQVVMRDVSEWLFPADRRLSRTECRQVLERVASVHATFWRESMEGLCDHQDRLDLFSPTRTTAERWSDADLPKLVGRNRRLWGHNAAAAHGWATFPRIVPADVAGPVMALVERPERISNEMDKLGATLIHGDLQLAHLGLRDDRLVMLEWGSTAAIGPPEEDFAWFLMANAERIDATRDELIEDFQAASGDRANAEALALSLLYTVVLFGCWLAWWATEAPTEHDRCIAEDDLEWWTGAARSALTTWPLGA